MLQGKAYEQAESRIEEARRADARELDLGGLQLAELPKSLGQLTQLQSLDLSYNKLSYVGGWFGKLASLQSLDLRHNELSALPESVEQLAQMQSLDLAGNCLVDLPTWLGGLSELQSLDLHSNELTALPESVGQLQQLRLLSLHSNRLTVLPESLGQLEQLQLLTLGSNQLTALPNSLGKLRQLQFVDAGNNPLNPELAAAYEQGFDAFVRYLRVRADSHTLLNEAKLILVGEGEVGKSCLLDALRGDPWRDHDTTHGIEIRAVNVTAPDGKTNIKLNGWDFGGQPVYRPTHRLFFSSPAVYLVVWKPREGPQQGFVKEWIRLVKHREPDAKILVVATHNGPDHRRPDIDQQELWDLFGEDTVLGFHHVDSKPDENGERRGIDELRAAIAQVAVSLPEVGRSVPKRWQQVREALQQTEKAYLLLDAAIQICLDHGMGRDEAELFIALSHRLGHLIHYEHEPALQNIVILKPDWLAAAISFVLDDEHTRQSHGLVDFARLGELWDNPGKELEFRYPADLHPVFLALMEKFDLSYQVAGLPENGAGNKTSLVAQLVPDSRPDLAACWPSTLAEGEEQKVQICRIVDDGGSSAPAEGLFYQLIVRLHKYSLGRVNYNESVHWQRGLVLDADYNGRALLEHIGNDVRITVQAAYPEQFLAILTNEVKWLVDNSWKGLRCDVMVPCLSLCKKNAPGTGLFKVQRLIDHIKHGHVDYQCDECGEWLNIDLLLRNAPLSRQASIQQLLADGLDEMRVRLDGIRGHLNDQDSNIQAGFQSLDQNDRRMMSRAEELFTSVMQTLTDEAKEGPRLFSFEPVEPGFLGRPKWISQKFRLTLWCEHSRLPLPELYGDGSKGVYELNLPREWFVKAAPFLRVLTTTLGLVLPVASSATKLITDEAAYKAIEDQLDFGKECVDSLIKAGEKVGDWLGESDSLDLERGEAIRAQGAVLRQLHAWLKEKDPSFGGLVRVQNKRHDFLWVHPQFEGKY